MMDNCSEIARHMHGCCIMQKSIDTANPSQKKLLILVIAKHTLTFVKDPFANYVIQYILDLKDPDVCETVG